MIKVLFICHGNICRSTMAESIFTHLVKERARLRQAGIPLVPHRARQMTGKDYKEFDYLIGMDDANIRNMERVAGGDPDHKIYKLLEFAGSGRAIADPWYTGNFDVTYDDIIEGCEALLDKIIS